VTLLSDLCLILGLLAALAAGALLIVLVGLAGVVVVLGVVAAGLLVLSLALVDGKGLPWRS
jgi:hypothetical protein